MQNRTALGICSIILLGTASLAAPVHRASNLSCFVHIHAIVKKAGRALLSQLENFRMLCHTCLSEEPVPLFLKSTSRGETTATVFDDS